MTNLEMMISSMGGLMVTAKPESISDKALRMVACPYESVEDPDAMEISGCPSETQCAACKRAWLAKPAEVK